MNNILSVTRHHILVPTKLSDTSITIVLIRVGISAHDYLFGNVFGHVSISSHLENIDHVSSFL